jgi:Flp pilus assembly protein TadG
MKLGRHRERGAAAVEMALILPLLILLVGGIVDLGRLFWVEVQITNAAREGARAGVVQGDVVARANAAGSTAAGWQTPTFTGSCTTTPDGDVTVQTSASFDFIFLNIIPGVPSSKTLTASATMGCL